MDPKTSSADDGLLITDDLHSLKEGDIYTDPESGKRYRVRKSILPGRAIGGPHGVGDPDDRTLRKIEADVLIPKRMNDQLERKECHPFYLKLVECFKKEGAAIGLSTCKETLNAFNRCKYERFHDPDFRAKVTEDYLAERSHYRRTGMTEKEQKLQEYRNWKAQNEA
ncbi:unnamed protein product, partial [Mesorhabditis spiculigera]